MTGSIPNEPPTPTTMPPLPSVTGKHALITGGSSGINLAFALLLHSRGCNILIGDLQPPPPAILPLSRTTKPLVLYHRTDVSNWNDLTTFFTFGLQNFSSIDIVVPGAGIFEPPGTSFWAPTLETLGLGPGVGGDVVQYRENPAVGSAEQIAGGKGGLVADLHSASGRVRRDSGYTTVGVGSGASFCRVGAGDGGGGGESAHAEGVAGTDTAVDGADDGAQVIQRTGGSDRGFLKVLDVNVMHPIRLGQLAVEYWVSKGMAGRLVCVGSVAGYGQALYTPVYVASKYAVNGFVRSLGRLKGELGIRVGAVAPGAVKTSMWLDDPDKAAMLGENDNFVPVEEVAEAMLQLCENEELGDGTILEVLKGKTRVVPLYGADAPTVEGGAIAGYVEAEKRLLGILKLGWMGVD